MGSVFSTDAVVEPFPGESKGQRIESRRVSEENVWSGGVLGVALGGAPEYKTRDWE